MADFFLGEIRIFSFNFAPENWALCDGSLLHIMQNAALFALISNRFGGDGEATFRLPDLRGRTPLHFGTSRNAFPYDFGERGGVEAVFLGESALPTHSHPVFATTVVGTTTVAEGGIIAAIPEGNEETPIHAVFAAHEGAITRLAPQSVSTAVGGQAHNNMQPFITMNFCIATTGIFPSRTSSFC